MSKKVSKNTYSSLVDDESEENLGNNEIDRRYSAVGSVPIHSIRPPVLESCSSIVAAIRFVDAYQKYEQFKGPIPMSACLGDIVFEKVFQVWENQQSIGEKSKKHPNRVFADVANFEVKELLYKTYQPKTAEKAWQVLETVKCPEQKSNLNLDACNSYVRLFIQVVELCLELGAKEEIMRIFLKNFGLPAFADRLTRMGL